MIIDILERNKEELQEIKDCFINTLSWIMKKRISRLYIGRMKTSVSC